VLSPAAIPNQYRNIISGNPPLLPPSPVSPAVINLFPSSAERETRHETAVVGVLACTRVQYTHVSARASARTSLN